MSNEQIVHLTGKSEYTIGRATDDQPVVPDVDLTPYGAYDFGISRLHATITVGDLITLTDMGSINGTHLNGREIQPHSSHPLVHGDVLTLGKMKIQVLIKT
jgi:pSer/pThr/pTyr-binding forkhead associated (FHA) protein